MTDTVFLPTKWSVRGTVCTALAILIAAFHGCGGSRGSSDDPIAEETTKEQASQQPLFRDVTDEVGLDFIHQTEPPGAFFLPEINGSGGALFDYDRDGDLDIYLVNLGSGYGKTTVFRETENRFTNRLYRQNDDGMFEDVTERSNVGDPRLGTGVAIGDVNNDGYPDVYVTNQGPDRLYLNRGDGTFVDITHEAGVDNPLWGMSACLFDYDRDGWLDIFVTNYVTYRDIRCTRVGGGDQDYCGPHMFPSTSDRLFRNETGDVAEDQSSNVSGDHPVRFRDVSISSGIATREGPGMGVTCTDFDGDGLTDIYVANDRTENFVWLNQGNGKFEESALLCGCAYDGRGAAQASMGIALGDVDGNSTLDMVVCGLDGEANAAYLCKEGGFWEDQAAVVGIVAPSLAHTGFGTALVDLDHDSDLDLAVVNGAVRRTAGKRRTGRIPSALAEFWHPYAEENQVFLNNGKGRLTELKCARDPFLGTAELSRSLAVGDVDNDGDVDFLVTNVASRARLYFNQAEKEGRWLQVQAVNPEWGGRDDYGAIVTVVAEDRRLVRLIQPSFSYLCANDPRAHFGLGEIDRVDDIHVVWSDGNREDFPACDVDQLVVLERGRGLEGE